jgi:photosynthetic reaction center H subunit
VTLLFVQEPLMPTGAITQYIDVAQLVLYAFWVFFAGLIYYLHRENKREGYPLASDRRGRVIIEGFPPVPRPKTYLLRSGRVVTAPNPERDDDRTFAARGAVPAGSPEAAAPNALAERSGPGSYALRADEVDLTAHDEARIVPLRTVGELGVERKDNDPRGLPVVGTDGVVGGVVRDLWVDRAEMLFRYLEVEVAGVTPARTVLLPIPFCRIKARRVSVDAITGAQFAGVPATKAPDRITLLEEERVVAYYGAGTLYATPQRAEPLL